VTEYPHLAELGEHARRFGYTVDGEFEFGLEVILEALSGLVNDVVS
jgi:hypothetical protein